MAELDTQPQVQPAPSYDEAQSRGLLNSYDPMPEAINTFNKVVGNPTTGTPSGEHNPSDSIERNMQNSHDYINSIVNNVSTSKEADPINTMKPFSYNGDYDGANFERYYHTPQFKQLGFDPHRYNESLYNNHMSTGDEFVRAATQWVPLAVT